MELKRIDVARMKRAGVPRLRGDAVAIIAAGALFRPANARVIITGVRVEASVPTRDPADRAHAHYDKDGWLVPAASLRGVPNPAVPEAKPRRYHPSQMTSRGVAFDSAFDATHRLRQELSGIPGIGIESACSEAAVLSRERRSVSRPS